jgi:hypothetical protein
VEGVVGRVYVAVRVGSGVEIVVGKLVEVDVIDVVVVAVV